MTNRRNFLARLFVVPALGFLSFKRKAQISQITGPINPYKYDSSTKSFKINPEWENAPYEFSYFTNKGIYLGPDPWPFRFRNIESAEAFLDRQIEVCNNQLHDI